MQITPHRESQRMAHLTVSEDMERFLARLFYAAGAVVGVARGLLEVTARLVLAGLHAAIAKEKSFTVIQAPITALEPPRTTIDDDSVLHTPETSGAPSAAASSVNKTLPKTLPPDASWNSIDAATWSSADVITTSSDAASGGSGSETPGYATDAQLPKVAAEGEQPAANAIDFSMIDDDTVLSVEDGGVGDTSLPWDPKVIAAGTAGGDPDADDVPAVVEAQENASEELVFLQPTHTSPLFAIELPVAEPVAAATSISEVSTAEALPRNGSVPDHPPVEFMHPLEPMEQLSEVVPELNQSLSPSHVLKFLRESEEALSESGESVNTVISYGTANSVDPLTGVSMPRRLKAATTTPSAASSTVSTPGLPLSQRLEERRHNDRRKGAHKAKAR
ncbi:hypothetical protein Vretimale_6806 [Volvox reticuliferus]|uniref:Uncharacterized protein n=1 Tax=Volvox reticuliferus TaxID=1737510 RepID=A0A8J4LL00_9CHLO|nr:hypothetical protein Vretifemale_7012 [Volvox reticuliferus]GIM02074.1 hypothetical protein Vretimale_6806 [Volvox reticuliferus]